jgi:hypothetical protein
MNIPNFASLYQAVLSASDPDFRVARCWTATSAFFAEDKPTRKKHAVKPRRNESLMVPFLVILFFLLCVVVDRSWPPILDCISA